MKKQRRQAKGSYMDSGRGGGKEATGQKREGAGCDRCGGEGLLCGALRSFLNMSSASLRPRATSASSHWTACRSPGDRSGTPQVWGRISERGKGVPRSTRGSAGHAIP